MFFLRLLLVLLLLLLVLLHKAQASSKMRKTEDLA